VQTLKTPPSEHRTFDELCNGVSDWEPMLAAPFAAPPDFELGEADGQDGGAIDEAIFAGLVSPY
jgi:hypothetical protein